jgi:nitrous oxide reductase accessory protein NosL
MMTLRRLVRLLAGVMALSVAACAGAAGAPGPRDFEIGVDVCEYCHMAVDDPGRAAQWVEPGGRRLFFDEPGCLVAWLQARPGHVGEAFFGDAEDTGWVPAAEVAFIREGPGTGMGFDVVAYRSPDAARQVAAETGGRVVGWHDLLREGVASVHGH